MLTATYTVTLTPPPGSVGGSISVTFTDDFGASSTCTVNYGPTNNCSSGFFFDGTTCVQSYLLTAFGATPTGGMGVGATGTADGSVPSPRVVPYIPNENVIKIQTGPRHSSIVTNLGNLYMAGLNGNGQLGINNTYNQEFFVQTTFFAGLGVSVEHAFPGGYHTLVLLNNSQVWGFGINTNGQLGQGPSASKGSYLLPVLVTLPGLGNEVALGVATAFQHSLVWTATRLYAFGCGDHGQVGSNSDVWTPTVVFTAAAGDSIQFATAGGYSSSLLTASGKVYAFGGNVYGTLGIGSYTNTPKPTQVLGLPTISFMSQAEKHSLFLSTEGALYAAGDNTCGNLGTGDTTNHPSVIQLSFFANLKLAGETIVSVGTGWSHSMVWTNKQLYTFGCDSSFNLGIPQTGTAPNYVVSIPTINPFYNSSNLAFSADCKGTYSLVLSKLL